MFLARNLRVEPELGNERHIHRKIVVQVLLVYTPIVLSVQQSGLYTPTPDSGPSPNVTLLQPMAITLGTWTNQPTPFYLNLV